MMGDQDADLKTHGGTDPRDEDRDEEWSNHERHALLPGSLSQRPSSMPQSNLKFRFPWRRLGRGISRRNAVILGVAVFATVLGIVAAVLGVVLPSRQQPGEPPYTSVVDLDYTKYQGLRLRNGVDAFLGMRFAAAPVGNLRWRAPVEPPRIEGVEKATRLPPICWGLAMGYPTDGVDEDCLFVNVWTPSGATPDSKLPVWIFIGGGGYISLTNANWNGAEVVEKSGHNIVMVNFNYRVGVFGFLASERVKENGDLNVGLLDQRMLLHWVKKHIRKFGGDPDHVVIHGASAGAGSVAMHMIAHGGRDDKLFVGAVAESIFFPAQPPVSKLEYQFDRVLNQTGCDRFSGTQQISCLRNLSTAALQAANFYQPFPGRPGWPQPLFYWTPCIDGTFIPDLPSSLFEQSRFVNVPVLFGTDTDEGSLFAPNADSSQAVATFLANNYPNLTPNHTDSILTQYSQPLPSLPQHEPYFPVASRAYGEATFICPSINVLNHLGNSSKRFSYRYNVQDDENTASGVGVPHLFEAAAVFGPGNIGGHAKASYWTYNAPIVPVVMKYWISFVRALDPNVYREEGSPEWKEWDNEGMERLVLETGKSRMEKVGEEERRRCAFWEGLSVVLEQKR